jgi:hypothetical protein
MKHEHDKHAPRHVPSAPTAEELDIAEAAPAVPFHASVITHAPAPTSAAPTGFCSHGRSSDSCSLAH